MTVSEPHAVSTPRSTKLELQPYRPRIGALVSGIDLADPIDETTRARLQKALLQYGVLFFRDQSFGPQRSLDVVRVFGEPYRQNRYSHELDGYPDIETPELQARFEWTQFHRLTIRAAAPS